MLVLGSAVGEVQFVDFAEILFLEDMGCGGMLGNFVGGFCGWNFVLSSEFESFGSFLGCGPVVREPHPEPRRVR